MAKKYKSNIKDINEYMTSKTCYNCQNVDNELGSKKIYKCCKCCIEIDRDINASINIYNKGSDGFVL
jgi:transposase